MAGTTTVDYVQDATDRIVSRADGSAAVRYGHSGPSSAACRGRRGTSSKSRWSAETLNTSAMRTRRRAGERLHLPAEVVAGKLRRWGSVPEAIRFAGFTREEGFVLAALRRSSA